MPQVSKARTILDENAQMLLAVEARHDGHGLRGYRRSDNPVAAVHLPGRIGAAEELSRTPHEPAMAGERLQLVGLRWTQGQLHRRRRQRQGESTGRLSSCRVFPPLRQRP